MPVVPTSDYADYLATKAKADLQAAYDSAMAPHLANQATQLANQQALAAAHAQVATHVADAHSAIDSVYADSTQRAQAALAPAAPVAPPSPVAADRGDRAAASAATPRSSTDTTAGLSGGGASSNLVGAAGKAIMAAAAQTAAWLGESGQRALQAVLLTEGGLAGARGDGGKSAGPLQFYEGGQLATFAQSKGLSLDAAKNYVEAHPDEAIAWAIGTQDHPGYLGAAILDGQHKNLNGADLATYAQQHGQVSVSPERAGQNYNTLFAGAPPPAAGPAPTAAVAPPDAQSDPATDTIQPSQPGQPSHLDMLQQYMRDTSPLPAGQSGVPADSAAPPISSQSRDSTGPGGAAAPRDSQFSLGLSDGDAYAACGPVAAVAFARSYGRNPTTAEAMQLARSVGWSPDQGMAGIASEKAMLDKIGVPTIMEHTVNWDHVATDANAGRPVIVSTTGHYFYVTGYDPQTGAYKVGTSGTDLRGGGDWMTPDQMSQKMGPTVGALYVDRTDTPAAPAPPSAPAAAAPQQTSAFSTPAAPAGPTAADMLSSYAADTNPDPSVQQPPAPGAA